MRSSLRAAALLLALAAATGAARWALQPEASAATALRDPAFLPSGKALRAVALGQRLVLADYWWLSLVQYAGESDLAHTPRWDAFLPMAELVTDLDPRYGYVYQEVGSLLSGVAHRVAESDRLLLKGIEGAPDRWQIPWNLGFNKLFYERDHAEAARWFRRAGEIGRRPHLFALAAAIQLDAARDAGGENYEVAIKILEEGLAQADSEAYRQDLAARLVKAKTYRVIAYVEGAARAHLELRGGPALTVDQLVWSRVIPRIPADPSGGRIVLEAPFLATARSTVLGPRQLLLDLQ